MRAQPSVTPDRSRPFFPDDSLPNGTSIALLAEYSGRRVLLAADAHEDRLFASLRALRGAGPPLHLDVFRLSHHGSAGNLSKRLLEEMDCLRYAVSSDGSHHGLPDRESIARILKKSGPRCELQFNYRSAYTTPWETLSAKTPARFSTVYGKDGWLKIELL